MATLTNLSKISKSFEKLKIMLDLETYLTHNKPTITGQAILNAINGKKFTHEQILQYVKDQAADSRKTMENCISEQLLNRILNYQP